MSDSLLWAEKKPSGYRTVCVTSLVSRRCLFEVFRTAFNTLALGAFRNILKFSAFKQGFHDYFTAAGTNEFVRGDSGT